MTTTNGFPRVVKLGDASMLCFITTSGDERMIATDLVSSIGKHRTKPGMSVVWVMTEGDDDERGVIPIPSIHPPKAFLNLGTKVKTDE